MCVQIIGVDKYKEIGQIHKLIELKALNKIIMFSDTAYRYGYNDVCSYETIQCGLYNNGNDTFEIQEFVKKD